MVTKKKTTFRQKTELKKKSTKQIKEKPAEYVLYRESKLKVTQTYDVSSLLNKFICGDVLTVMKSMPSESIDLVVTSPPYNLKNSTGNGMKDGRAENGKTPL